MRLQREEEDQPRATVRSQDKVRGEGASDKLETREESVETSIPICASPFLFCDLLTLRSELRSVYAILQTERDSRKYFPLLGPC